MRKELNESDKSLKLILKNFETFSDNPKQSRKQTILSPSEHLNLIQINANKITIKRKSNNIQKALVIIFIILICILILFAIEYNTENKSKYEKFEFNFTQECGLHFFQPNVKIAGGVEARPNSWPSTAYILFNYKFYSLNKSTILIEKYQCGGTLIDKDIVLTAAHCFLDHISYELDGIEYNHTVVPNEFHPTYESMYEVYLGLHSVNGVFNTSLDLAPSQKFLINKFKLHEEYDNITNLNDIALIKLENQVTFTNFIQPACLPLYKDYSFSYDKPAWAVGWGELGHEQKMSTELYNVKMTIYSDEDQCSGLSEPLDWNIQICAGDIRGGIDTCSGDSGGPLFVQDIYNGKKKTVLVGITSIGYKCAEIGYPGIYTKVSAYLDWIKNNI